jgi:hypothetical protein
MRVHKHLVVKLNNLKQKKMKKFFLALGLVLVSLTGFAQTTAPDATKPYLIFDATYELQPVGAATPTDVAIYYDNAGSTAIKAVQYRFWYDKNVFDAPTVTYVGSETNNYFQNKVDATEGNVTVTWVYTGADANFNIADGQMFNVALPFKSSYQNGPVTAMAFTGATAYPAYGTVANGTDTTLGLHNYGGAFTEPVFEYAATFKNSPSNPAENIPVILQKSSDGNTWVDVATVNTDANGVANFDEFLDQTYWDLRVKVAPGLDASSALSTADADMMAQIATGVQSASGTKFYTGNPNQANGITISDSYTVFSRLAQGLAAYPNNPDVLFFTEAEYNQIAASSTDLSGTIPGVATFLSANINNTTAANYYLLVLGDVNGTGLN